MPLSRTRRSRKTPLVFTESPVESRQTPITPVLCADRPVTATSVPISDHSNHPWVSPQFPYPHNYSGKRKHKLRNKVNKSLMPDKGNTQDCNPRTNFHHKYRALIFLKHLERDVQGSQTDLPDNSKLLHPLGHHSSNSIPEKSFNQKSERSLQFAGDEITGNDIRHAHMNSVALPNTRQRLCPRASTNTREKTSNLNTGAVSDQGQCCKLQLDASLLVVDTPEHEYHLSYRQRQLKKSQKQLFSRA